MFDKKRKYIFYLFLIYEVLTNSKYMSYTVNTNRKTIYYEFKEVNE